MLLFQRSSLYELRHISRRPLVCALQSSIKLVRPFSTHVATCCARCHFRLSLMQESPSQHPHTLHPGPHALQQSCRPQSMLLFVPPRLYDFIAQGQSPRPLMNDQSDTAPGSRRCASPGRPSCRGGKRPVRKLGPKLPPTTCMSMSICISKLRAAVYLSHHWRRGRRSWRRHSRHLRR